MDQITFAVSDGDGQQRKYIHTLHPAWSGHKLFLRVARALGPSLGTLIDAMDGVEPGNVLDTEIDFGRMGSAAGVLAESLIADDELIRDLLVHTARVGKGDGFGRLSESSVFDLAYQGNYGELMGVVARVTWDNFGRSLTRSNPLAGLVGLGLGVAAPEPGD